jgi:hypothetical protein
MKPKNTDLSDDALLIRTLGMQMYGPRWLRPLAAAMGVSPTLLSLIMSGKRLLTSDVEGKILVAFEHRKKEVRKIQDGLSAAIRFYGEILSSRSGEWLLDEDDWSPD